MKPHNATAGSLVTELLLLPDGSVLADRLTPTMLQLLLQMHLRTDVRTQCPLQGEGRVDTPPLAPPDSGTPTVP
jgi:hypothetical protein